MKFVGENASYILVAEGKSSLLREKLRVQFQNLKLHTGAKTVTVLRLNSGDAM